MFRFFIVLVGLGWTSVMLGGCSRYMWWFYIWKLVGFLVECIIWLLNYFFCVLSSSPCFTSHSAWSPWVSLFLFNRVSQASLLCYVIWSFHLKYNGAKIQYAIALLSLGQGVMQPMQPYITSSWGYIMLRPLIYYTSRVVSLFLFGGCGCLCLYLHFF
jgi:hypothetical protein